MEIVLPDRVDADRRLMNSTVSFSNKGERITTKLFTSSEILRVEKFETTSDVLSSLTPHEAAVLRRRFGIANVADDAADSDSDFPPPSDDDDNGSGGVPAAPNLLY